MPKTTAKVCIPTQRSKPSAILAKDNLPYSTFIPAAIPLPPLWSAWERLSFQFSLTHSELLKPIARGIKFDRPMKLDKHGICCHLVFGWHQWEHLYGFWCLLSLIWTQQFFLTQERHSWDSNTNHIRRALHPFTGIRNAIWELFFVSE